jgi:hypothetical protein
MFFVQHYALPFAIYTLNPALASVAFSELRSFIAGVSAGFSEGGCPALSSVALAEDDVLSPVSFLFPFLNLPAIFPAFF